MTEERRSWPRGEAPSIPAMIAVGKGQRRKCDVANLSREGALLRLSADVLLPGTFTLLIPARGIEKVARLVWRRAREAGVQFV
jgi:hypothetical protein